MNNPLPTPPKLNITLTPSQVSNDIKKNIKLKNNIKNQSDVINSIFKI